MSLTIASNDIELGLQKLNADFPGTEQKLKDLLEILIALGVTCREGTTSLILDAKRVGGPSNLATIHISGSKHNQNEFYLRQIEPKNALSWNKFYDKTAELCNASAWSGIDCGLDLQKMLNRRAEWCLVVEDYLKSCN